MAEVTDPNGVQWSVYRARPKWEWLGSSGGSNGGGPGDLLAPVLVPILEFVLSVIVTVVKWPLWFITKLLGVPSTILIERDGARVGAERVRGWGKSQRRIQEIAESAAAGTLEPGYYPGYPSRNYRKVRNYRDSFWR